MSRRAARRVQQKGRADAQDFRRRPHPQEKPPGGPIYLPFGVHFWSPKENRPQSMRLGPLFALCRGDGMM